MLWFLGDIETDNVILGFESPKYISFFSDTWLKRRIEIELERNEKQSKYPTMLTWKMYSRRRSYLFYVSLYYSLNSFHRETDVLEIK